MRLFTLIVIAVAAITLGCTSRTANDRASSAATKQGSSAEETKKRLNETFPSAPDTVRHLNCFRNFDRTATVLSVVRTCGRPDADAQGALWFFTYTVPEGTIILFADGKDQPLRLFELVDYSGTHTSLFKAN